MAKIKTWEDADSEFAFAVSIPPRYREVNKIKRFLSSKGWQAHKNNRTNSHYFVGKNYRVLYFKDNQKQKEFIEFLESKEFLTDSFPHRVVIPPDKRGTPENKKRIREILSENKLTTYDKRGESARCVVNSMFTTIDFKSEEDAVLFQMIL